MGNFRQSYKKHLTQLGGALFSYTSSSTLHFLVYESRKMVSVESVHRQQFLALLTVLRASVRYHEKGAISEPPRAHGKRDVKEV